MFRKLSRYAKIFKKQKSIFYRWKLKIDSRNISEKPPNIWKLNIILLNNQRLKKKLKGKQENVLNIMKIKTLHIKCVIQLRYHIKEILYL